MLPGLLGPPVQEGVTLAEYLAVQVDHFAKTFRNQVQRPRRRPLPRNSTRP